MTIDPLVVLVIGVITVNLVVVLLLVRGGDGVREVLLDDVERRGDGRDGTSESNLGRVPGPSDPPGIGDRTDSNADERARPEALPVGDPPSLSTDGDVVVCQHCGAENRPGYRYCRWCVRSGFVGADPGSEADAGAAGRPF